MLAQAVQDTLFIFIKVYNFITPDELKFLHKIMFVYNFKIKPMINYQFFFTPQHPSTNPSKLNT